MSFGFAGALGSMLQVWHGPTEDTDGSIVWQLRITLTIESLDGSGPGELAEVWTVPEDATPDQLAGGIHARAVALLSHEVLESMRWRQPGGVPLQVFDAHPTPRAEDSIDKCIPLRPWATPR